MARTWYWNHFNSPTRYNDALANLQKIGTGEDMPSPPSDRTAILAFWKTHGLAATTDAFGVSRSTLFRWQRCPAPKSRARLTQERRSIPPALQTEILRLKGLHPELGKGQLQPLLARFCRQQGVAIPCESTVGRYLSDLRKAGLLKKPVKLRLNGRTGVLKETHHTPKPKKRRAGYQPGLPGDLLQVDTIVTFINGLKRYTVTAIDLPSRFSFAWSYSSLSSNTSTDFLSKLRLAAPFSISRVQTDNGLEFMGHFRESLVASGTTQFFNRPRNPKQNAFIERFNRTIQEEFLYRHTDTLAYDLPTHNQLLMDYLIYYNAERPHTGLKKQTPLEYLQLTPQSQMGWTSTAY